MPSFYCTVISDLAVTDHFIHSLSGMILLYLTTPFFTLKVFCMRYYSIYVFSVLSLCHGLTSDHVAVNVSIHSLPGIIILYLVTFYTKLLGAFA